MNALYAAVMGFHDTEGIIAIFNGGGLVSMLNTCVLLLSLSVVSGIIAGTGIIDGLQEKFSRMIKKFGAYPVVLCVGTMCNALFMNQTVGVIMTGN